MELQPVKEKNQPALVKIHFAQFISLLRQWQTVYSVVRLISAVFGQHIERSKSMSIGWMLSMGRINSERPEEALELVFCIYQFALSPSAA